MAVKEGRGHLRCGWSTQPLEVIREASERARARKGGDARGLTVLERAFWEKQSRSERSEARRLELWEERQRNSCDI